MTKQLHISEDLALPIEFVTQTQAILARKRVGNSYTASVQAEEMLRLQQQVLVIDYTGAWWGLRAGANGKAEGGYPIHVFGGDHADVPLEERAGEVIAAAAVKERFSAILDLSHFRKGEALRFLSPFLETLYRLSRDALHLFADECDAYAPQKTFGGDDARTLGAMNDIVRRGGIRGIGCTLISQRPAVINKDILTMCSVLTCLRISHPKDIAPVKEWVDLHDVGNQATEMIKSLPSLPIGTAWMWAPGWPDDKGIFKRIQIRKRNTFDSGATPKPGQTVKSPKSLKPVDLIKLGETIRQTAEQAKTNDPAVLKRRIADLEKQLNAQPSALKRYEQMTVEKPVITDKQIDRLEKLQDRVERALEAWLKRSGEAINPLADLLKGQRDEIVQLRNTATGIRQIAEARPVIPGLIPAHQFASEQHQRRLPELSSGKLPAGKVQVLPDGVKEASISGPVQKILDAFAFWHSVGVDRPSRENVAPIAGYTSVRSSGFRNPLYECHAKGLVENEALTATGRAMARWPHAVHTLADYHAKLMRVMDGPEQKLFQALHERGECTRDELAAATGYGNPRSSGFRNPLYRLSSMGLVDLRKEQVVPTKLMYPEALQ